MAGLGEIFGVEQRQEFRIADEVVPGEADQPLDRLGRIEMFEIEAALLGTDLVVGGFQHREVEVFLVADMVVQHALVGAGIGRDAVDARTGKAMRGELLLGGLENADPHAFGVALPFQGGFCLCQIRCSMMPWDSYVACRGRFENAEALYQRHCEERSDEAIQRDEGSLDCFASPLRSQ